MKMKIRTIFINIVVFLSLLIGLTICLEVYLKFFGKNIQITSGSPFFIHSSHRNNDRYIDSTGFRDIHGFRTISKTNTNSLIIDTYQWFLQNDDKCSILIIGDSSPYGDGMLPENTWPSKFSSKTKCKVFTFAQNGWSSLQMFEFYDKYLKHLNFSYIVVSIVHNDAELIGSYKEFEYKDSVIVQKYFTNFFPWTVQKIWWKIKNKSEVAYIFDNTLNKFFTQIDNRGSLENPPIITWGYSNWVERMWENDIQEIWRKALKRFYEDNRDKNIIYFFAINLLSEDKDYLSISKYLKSQNINYLYCREERIKMGQRKREDWANLADAHPGKRQVKLFSECLTKYFDTKF